MESENNTRCIAETQILKMHHAGSHTVRCEKEPGHEGFHEYKKNARTTLWLGPAQKVEDNTKYRFGFKPNWQHR